MLLASVLNSDAEINAYDIIGSVDFIPGEAFRLVIQLKQKQRKDQLRYIAPASALLTMNLNKAEGESLAKSATAFTLDRSIWYVDISAAESIDLVGGNITFDLDVLGDATKIVKGFIENGMSLQITGACC